jgi:general secretion pathway protein G
MRTLPRRLNGFVVRVIVGIWLFYGVCVIWYRVSGLGYTGSRVATDESRISSWRTALETYQLDNGSPPTTEQGLDALLRPPVIGPPASNWQGPYLAETRSIPHDSWGHAYLYSAPGPNGEPFLVTCLGRNGKPGGEGENADITSSR